jgi:RNA polymerase sigma factor (sigma-70 family)
MAHRPFSQVFRYLHRAVGVPLGEERTDGQLLERFSTEHDSAAFEAILQRHGRLVWGVCQRLLHDPHDAEDAFQATFLVLTRRAASVQKRSSLGSWLYGVAYRVAWNVLRSKVRADRRRTYERQVEDMPQREEGETSWRELRPVLDAELERLPEKYRAPLVLCYLEGKTNQQAAEELGWPAGSVSKRLARGRELLRDRLTGRGVALSSAVLGTVLVENAATAAVPSFVLDRTLSVAHVLVSTAKLTTAGVASAQVSALTEGVVNAMWLSKLKAIAALLVLAAALTGSGVFVHQVLADKPPPAAQAAEQPKDPPAAEKGPRASKLDLTPDSFAKLHALIRPQENEWRHLKVRWITDPVAALKKATTEDKPLVYLYLGGAGYNAPLGSC